MGRRRGDTAEILRRVDRDGRAPLFQLHLSVRPASSNRGTNMVVTKLIATTAFGALLVGGCGRKSENNSSPAKVRVGYIGLTCEAPIFTAVEKGFFKEEVLDVS